MKLILISMAVLLLPCMTGCGTSEHADAHEDDHHLEHFIPHHKPANFSEAVADISHRSEHLSEHAGHGHDDEAEEFEELLDIVDWIPELAADSDLKETDWKNAVAAAAAMKTLLESRKAADGTLNLKDLTGALANESKTLEGLIAAAGKPEQRIEHDHDHDHEEDDHDHEEDDHEHEEDDNE